jgi:hypothetical protein
MTKFYAPQGVTGASIDGQAFEVAQGTIELNEEQSANSVLVQTLKEHGFIDQATKDAQDAADADAAAITAAVVAVKGKRAR